MCLPTTIAPYYAHSAVGASDTLLVDSKEGRGGEGAYFVTHLLFIYLFHKRECLPEHCKTITTIITYKIICVVINLKTRSSQETDVTVQVRLNDCYNRLKMYYYLKLGSNRFLSHLSQFFYHPTIRHYAT
jgi:hypothetical protein